MANGQFNYSTNSGEITITGYTGMDATVVIPEIIDGLPVTAIGDYAFNPFGGAVYPVRAISFPAGITRIGNGAFSDTELTSIVIPNTVTNVGAGAFAGCQSATSITVGTGIHELPSSIFAYCGKVASIILPDNIASIGNAAFSRCLALTSVTLSSTLTNIGDHAFEFCSQLRRIDLPAGITTIGLAPFSDCQNLDQLILPGSNPFFAVDSGALIDLQRSVLLQYLAAKPDASYTIPPVSAISDGAFFHSQHLVEITIPPGVQHIGNEAFRECTNLARVIIPSSVETIGVSSFSGCLALTNAAFSTGSSALISIGDNAFANAGLLQFETPATVQMIGSGAFSGCRRLSSITLPPGLETIGGSAFMYCGQLSTITIPDKVAIVRQSTFEFCTNLASVIFGKGITNIEAEAFAGAAFRTITIPDRVVAIGTQAFSTSTLRSAFVGKGLKTFGIFAFGFGPIKALYFLGDAPQLDPPNAVGPFASPPLYYMPGTTGWGTNFCGYTTVLWNPHVAPSDSPFGMQPAGFYFRIKGPAGLAVVVEASSELQSPVWTPVSTNTMLVDSSIFLDPRPLPSPSRFYRFRAHTFE